MTMRQRVRAQLDRQLLGDLYIGKEKHAQAARYDIDQRVCVWRPGRSIRWHSISEGTGTAHLAATCTSPSQVGADSLVGAAGEHAS